MSKHQDQAAVRGPGQVGGRHVIIPNILGADESGLHPTGHDAVLANPCVRKGGINSVVQPNARPKSKGGSGMALQSHASDIGPGFFFFSAYFKFNEGIQAQAPIQGIPLVLDGGPPAVP